MTPYLPLVFIVGMPAAGKTFWGSEIALQMGVAFTDLDAYIIMQEQQSIADLFATQGEQAFRDLEHKYLTALINATGSNSIISCGGGTPCFCNNMALMKQAGIVIYLRAGIRHLLHNLQRSPHARPLLRNQPDATAYLSTLMTERSFFYEQAHFTVQAEDVSFSTFAQIITSCINRH